MVLVIPLLAVAPLPFSDLRARATGLVLGMRGPVGGPTLFDLGDSLAVITTVNGAAAARAPSPLKVAYHLDVRATLEGLGGAAVLLRTTPPSPTMGSRRTGSTGGPAPQW